MRAAALCWCAAFALLVPTSGSAQTARVLLSEAVKAYNDLEFAAASQLLRRALAPEVRPALVAADRERALMYLGASELLGGDRTAAVAAFRTLLLERPRYRPDSLVFPPRVARVVSEVAQATKAVAIVAPPEHAFFPGAGALPLHLYATSPHLVRAILLQEGRQRRVLYDGAITDSLVLWWDGLGADGAPARSGVYTVEVASLVTAGSVLRSLRLPLEVRVEAPDTLPWPPASRTARGGPDLRFLAPGVALGALLAVPAIFGSVDGEGTRIALGVTLLGLGVAGSLAARDRTPPVADAPHVEATRRENARRRARPRLVVRAGAPERIEAKEP